MEVGRRSRRILHAYPHGDPDMLHPNTYDKSISPVIQKSEKADYSIPRAWRLVQLLSMMSKWIKSVIATRLLYYATKHRLTPLNQVRAMPVKSTRRRNMYSSRYSRSEQLQPLHHLRHDRMLRQSQPQQATSGTMEQGYTATNMKMGIVGKQTRDQDESRQIH